MLDAVIILVLVIFAAVGYHRGLLQSIFSLVSSIVAIVLASFIYPYVNMVLKYTPIYTNIYKWVDQQVSGIDLSGGIQSQGNAIISSITWLPPLLTEKVKVNNNAAVYQLLGATDVKEYVCLYIVQLIMGMLALLITWLLIKLIFMGTLKTLLTGIASLPVISGINRTGGLLLGIVLGGFMLSLIGLLVPLLIAFPNFEQVETYIQTSVLGKWLYDNNLILLAYDYVFTL